MTRELAVMFIARAVRRERGPWAFRILVATTNPPPAQWRVIRPPENNKATRVGGCVYSNAVG